MTSYIKEHACKIYSFSKRVTNRLIDDRISLVSAGVAFFIFLSIFPALASIISLYGLLTNAADIQHHLAFFADMIPTDAYSLIENQIIRFTESGQEKLGGGFIVGLAISLWSANKAMKAIAQSLNIAFDFKEDRGLLKINIVTLGLTFVSSITFTFTLAILIIVPVLVSSVLTREAVEGFVVITSWLILASTIFLIFTMLYLKAPAMHGRFSLKTLSPGSAVSTLLLLMGSLAFSVYVANYGKYDAQYGTLASVVITMLWLYLGSFIFLVGAEVNATLIDNGRLKDKACERVSASEA